MILLPPPKAIPFPEEWKPKLDINTSIVSRKFVLTTSFSSGKIHQESYTIQNLPNGQIFILHEIS